MPKKRLKEKTVNAPIKEKVYRRLQDHVANKIGSYGEWISKIVEEYLDREEAKK